MPTFSSMQQAAQLRSWAPLSRSAAWLPPRSVALAAVCGGQRWRPEQRGVAASRGLATFSGAGAATRAHGMLRKAYPGRRFAKGDPNPARKAENFGRKTWVIDAENQVLGRVASEIASLLLGKHKPVYDPAVMAGDDVVVINCASFATTGKKRSQKLYRKHTGYRLDERSMERLLARRPKQVMRNAVSGMLPKNRLRNRILAQRLAMYEGADATDSGFSADEIEEARAEFRVAQAAAGGAEKGEKAAALDPRF